MKISEMLEREDFYSILTNTLDEYRDIIRATDYPISVKDRNASCSLFVNEQLNAIVSKRPSKAVKNYLLTEYNINGSLLKKIAVKAYTLSSLLMVKHFAQKGLAIDFKDDVDINSLLIYPCNKKIRLFNFKEGAVYTILKHDFPSLYIDREVTFRHSHNVSFVPPITASGKGWYSEKIIKGRPIARINDYALVKRLKEDALQQLMSLNVCDDKMTAKEYLERIKNECIGQLKQKKAFSDFEKLESAFNNLKIVGGNPEITLVISHGDFQPGNIWWDEEDNRIVLIDWETVKPRSWLYDYATLNLEMRKGGRYQQVVDRIKNPNEVSYTSEIPPEITAKIVMAEELAYQTEELISFPGTIGLDEYDNVLDKITNIRI